MQDHDRERERERRRRTGELNREESFPWTILESRVLHLKSYWSVCLAMGSRMIKDAEGNLLLLRLHSIIALASAWAWLHLSCSCSIQGYKGPLRGVDEYMWQSKRCGIAFTSVSHINSD